MTESMPRSDEEGAKHRLLRSIDTALLGTRHDYLLYNAVLIVVRVFLVVLLWSAILTRARFAGVAVVAAAVVLAVYLALEVYVYLLVRRKAYWSKRGEGPWN